MKNIAVFVSGSGSNLQNLIYACENGEINGKICLVISSKADAFALERAKKHNIEGVVYDKNNYANLEKMYSDIIKLLKEKNIDLILLAGYMLIMTENIILEYRNKIINVHPSLIPAFCGKGYYGLKVHKAVIDYGAKVTGATVHFVDEGADTGAIIIQECINVMPDDTPESLQKRVLEIEHKIYKNAVKLFCLDKLDIDGRIVKIIN